VTAAPLTVDNVAMRKNKCAAFVIAGLVMLAAGCSSTKATTTASVGVPTTAAVAPTSTSEPSAASAPTTVAVTASSTTVAAAGAEPKLVSAALISSAEATAAIGEPLKGPCTTVETQFKCEFVPEAAGSPIEGLLVDCNSVFGFAEPSPRMAAFTDTPAVVEELGKQARFRTMETPSRKAELEMELDHPPVRMCSVQLTIKKTAPPTPVLADYRDKLLVIAKAVAARLA
jgi:hypothetical protein